MKLKFHKTIRKQLKALSRTTRRTPEEIVEILVQPLLNQIVEGNDIDLLQLVLEQ
jgi:mRNA-degrading endonuclease RelE of RelBE toxin-antitoxin system